MNRLPAVIAIAGSVLGSSSALAADLPHSLTAKRQFAGQVIACMRKRMAADQHISYNQAARVCKDEITRLDGVDSGPLVAADTKH
jgi:hypothetical protein